MLTDMIWAHDALPTLSLAVPRARTPRPSTPSPARTRQTGPQQDAPRPTCSEAPPRASGYQRRRPSLPHARATTHSPWRRRRCPTAATGSSSGSQDPAAHRARPGSAHRRAGPPRAASAAHGGRRLRRAPRPPRQVGRCGAGPPCAGLPALAAMMRPRAAAAGSAPRAPAASAAGAGLWGGRLAGPHGLPRAARAVADLDAVRLPPRSAGQVRGLLSDTLGPASPAARCMRGSQELRPEVLEQVACPFPSYRRSAGRRV